MPCLTISVCVCECVCKCYLLFYHCFTIITEIYLVFLLLKYLTRWNKNIIYIVEAQKQKVDAHDGES